MARMLQCPWTGKSVHFTMSSGMKAANHETKKAGIDIRAYRCRKCTYFHLTSQVGKKNKRKREIPDGDLPNRT